MTRAANAKVVGVEHRARVIRDRVECWLAESVEIARCRECDYLVRLESPIAGDQPRVVICGAPNQDADVEFAW